MNTTPGDAGTDRASPSNSTMLFAALKLPKSFFGFGEIRRHHGQTMFKMRAARTCRIADISQIEIWLFAEKLFVFSCEFGECRFSSGRPTEATAAARYKVWVRTSGVVRCLLSRGRIGEDYVCVGTTEAKRTDSRDTSTALPIP